MYYAFPGFPPCRAGDAPEQRERGGRAGSSPRPGAAPGSAAAPRGAKPRLVSGRAGGEAGGSLPRTEEGSGPRGGTPGGSLHPARLGSAPLTTRFALACVVKGPSALGGLCPGPARSLRWVWLEKWVAACQNPQTQERAVKGSMETASVNAAASNLKTCPWFVAPERVPWTASELLGGLAGGKMQIFHPASKRELRVGLCPCASCTAENKQPCPAGAGGWRGKRCHTKAVMENRV